MPHLPLINTTRNNYTNFYSVCIKAIKRNNNKILNDFEFLRKIEDLKNKHSIKKKKKYLSYSAILKPGFLKKSLTERETRLTNKKVTLIEIIKECRILDSKKLINKIPLLNEINQENNKSEDNLPNILDKATKRTSLTNKEETKSNINKPLKTKTRFSRTNLPRNYVIFKKNMEYLESNDITLFEFLKKNPFQKRPFQISKSFEFLNAVKFKNYDYVIAALTFSTSYLFSFDYYGQTCYHWTSKLSNVKMLKLLLEFGKHHNQKDFRGRTPLYLASVNDDRTICEILIKNRANIYLTDENGYTAYDVAGSKDLKYYLGELLVFAYSNPSCKQRTANFLRERNDRIKAKKIMEDKNLEKKKNEGESKEEEEENDDKE